MQRIREVILILSLITNVALGYILYSNSSKVESNSEEFIAKIDSLELELSNLEVKRDSVNKEIDTVFVKLTVIEKEYEEKYINILSNSTSDDYVFSQTISNEIKRDSTVLITSDQLKRTNLIFVEHEALLKTNSLLHQQLANYKLNNNLLLRSDSIHKVEIDKYKLLTESFSSEITSLNKEIKRRIELF